MLWECLCFSASGHRQNWLLTLGCPLHVFPKELGPGTSGGIPHHGDAFLCQALQRCLFPPTTLARGDHCSHFIHEEPKASLEGT